MCVLVTDAMVHCPLMLLTHQALQALWTARPSLRTVPTARWLWPAPCSRPTTAPTASLVSIWRAVCANDPGDAACRATPALLGCHACPPRLSCLLSRLGSCPVPARVPIPDALSRPPPGLYSSTQPAISGCSGIRIACWSGAYPLLTQVRGWLGQAREGAGQRWRAALCWSNEPPDGQTLCCGQTAIPLPSACCSTSGRPTLTPTTTSGTRWGRARGQHCPERVTQPASTRGCMVGVGVAERPGRLPACHLGPPCCRLQASPIAGLAHRVWECQEECPSAPCPPPGV